jgi:hypothetical protein
MHDHFRFSCCSNDLRAVQMQEMRQAFETFDTDGGGSVDVDELQLAMKSLGQYLTKKETQALMLELDSSGDGSIQFEEFVEYLKPKMLTGSTDLLMEIRGMWAQQAERHDPIRTTICTERKSVATALGWTKEADENTELRSKFLCTKKS